MSSLRHRTQIDKELGPTKNWKRTIRRCTDRCWLAWQAGDIVRPSVVFWPRLRTSLALFDPNGAQIKVHPDLSKLPSNVIREVLTHELAHYMASVRSNKPIRPHGPEWQRLMTEAGYEPRVRVPVASIKEQPNTHSRQQLRYRHFCPVCHFERFARSPQKRWRCAKCVDAGLSGQLLIETTDSSTKDDT